MFITSLKLANKYPLCILLPLICEVGSRYAIICASDVDIEIHSYTETDSFEEIFPSFDFVQLPQFKNEMISKNGTDWVLESDIQKVVFICMSRVPVKWTLPNFNDLSFEDILAVESTEERISIFGKDSMQQEPINISFQNKLQITLTRLEFFSANFTCSTVESQTKVVKSIHIFLNGQHLIESEGKTLQVAVDTASQQPIIIPCRPSTPEIKLQLQQQTDRLDWVSIPMSSDVKFDPKIGFLLNKNPSGRSILGFYKCSVINDDIPGNYFVYINVTSKTVDNKFSTKFQSKSILKGKASVNVSLFAYSDFVTSWIITCCSGISDKPPDLYAPYCSTPFQCELVKDRFVDEFLKKDLSNIRWSIGNQAENSTDCVETVLYSEVEFIACEGENVNFVEQYVRVFHPAADSSVANRSANILQNLNKDNKINGMFKNATTLSIYRAMSNTEQTFKTMILLLGKGLERDVLQYYDSSKPSIYFPGQVDDVVENIYDAIDAVDSIWKNSEGIQEYDRDVLYEGEPVIFMCFGTGMFHSRGAQLRLNWKNGTKTFPNVADKYLSKQLFLSGLAEINSQEGDQMINFFSINITVKQEMSSVDCWMPVRSSSKWDKISKNLKILPSVAPTFVEKEAETVYFYLGDKQKVVTCTVKDGLPQPKVKALRNGRVYVINSDFHESNHNSGDTPMSDIVVTKTNNKISIEFVTIQHEHQGILKCIADNINGTASRIIHVYVIEKRGITIPIMLSMVAVLTLIVIGLGIKRWRANTDERRAL